ncbi:hypothetical protein [Thermococcus sp.]|uniref:hypothetical protein n=1 Tax=Thermococcus sp. TaxID=35749 RepID=UPI0026071E77|nr:hypothetical protein [Thermococcus sp.]
MKDYMERAKRPISEKGVEIIDDVQREILHLNSIRASLNYKLYEVYTTNRLLAIKILGYASENKMLGGNGLSKEVEEIVEYYLKAGRKNER